MKKIATIATIGLSCALAFSLAACGGDDDGGNNSQAPNPNDVKTEQVTEDGWKSAFDFSNVTNVTFCVTNKITTSNNSYNYESNAYTKFDGNKICIEEEFDDIELGHVSTTEYYSVVSGAAYHYEYDSSAKKWEKEETSWYPTVSDSVDDIPELAQAYSSFAYNSSKDAYVTTNSDICGDFDSISVKITSGKMAVIRCEVSESEGGITGSNILTYQAYDYGTTKVTLPTLEGEEGEEGEDPGDEVSGEQVTKEQWDAAMSAERFYNVKCVNIVEARGQVMTQTYKFDSEHGCVYYEDSFDTKRITAYIDGEGFRFTPNGDDWQYYDKAPFNSLEQELLATIAGVTSAFDYTKFTFNENKYEASNYNDEVMGDTVLDKVSLVFDNGYLVQLTYSATINGVEQTAVMQLSDYGATTVERPNVDIPEEGDDDKNKPEEGYDDKNKPEENEVTKPSEGGDDGEKK